MSKKGKIIIYGAIGGVIGLISILFVDKINPWEIAVRLLCPTIIGAFYGWTGIFPILWTPSPSSAPTPVAWPGSFDDSGDQNVLSDRSN